MKSSWKRLWMLVSVLVLVGTMAGCGLFGDDDPDDDEDPETVTVYFYNSEGWDEVYAYSNDVEGMGSPGEEASEDPDADDWYMIEVERDVLSDPMDIVFHNNDGDEGESAYINHPNQVYTSVRGDVFGSRGGVVSLMNVTLYFYNSEGWGSVHAQSDDIDMLNDNPEVEADPENDDWFMVTIPRNLDDSPATVTFNDGDVDSGTPVYLDDHEATYLTVEEEGAYRSIDAAESAISGVFTTIYFYNEAGWDTVNAWAWTDDGNIFDEWPGEAAEPVEDRDNWYFINLPGIESTENLEIIFNDGSDQTGDTPIDGDNVYVVYEGHEEVASTYSSFDEAEGAADQVTFDLWFYNDQGWDTVLVDAETADETIFDGEAAVRDGESNWWSIEIPADLEEVDVDVTFHDDDANVGDTLTFTEDGDYYLTADENVMYEGRTQAYFNNEDAWDNVRADLDTAVATPEAFLTDIEAIQGEDDDWYMIDIPVNFGENDYELTFHDGDVNEAETAMLTEDGDRYFTMKADETYSTRNQAEAWMGAEAEDFITVYYYNSEGWNADSMYAYNWSTSDEHNEILGNWPGTPVEQDPDDSEWVMVEVPVDLSQLEEDDEFNMIFNDQSADVQTESILVESEDELYLAYNENTYADKASAEEGMANTEVTFYNTGEWSTVYADAETTDEALLSDTEAVQDGDTDWWTVEVPTSLALNDVTLTFHDGADAEVEVVLSDGDNLLINMDGISDYETRALNELYYDQDTSEYVDVYFYNAGAWSDVNAYAWDDDDNNPFGGWPGSPVFTDDTDEDWLYIGADWDLDATNYSIIFNGDDGDVQTDNITLTNNTDVFITPYGTVHETRAAAETEVEDRASTEVHFYNSESWTDVYAHYWGGATDGTDWPGIELSDADSDDWYAVDVPSDAWLQPFSLNFNNNNGLQTVDFTIDNTEDVYIVLDGGTDDGNLTIEKYDSSTAAEDALTD